MNEDFDAKKFKTKTNLNEYTKLLKAANVKRSSKTNSFNINSFREPISSNTKIIINPKIMSKLSIHENSLTKRKNQLLNNINKLKLNNANDDRSSNTSNLNNLNLVNNLLQENKLNYVCVKETQNVLLQNQKINPSQFQTKVITNSQVNSHGNSPRTIILEALSPENKNNNNNHIRFSSNEKIYLDAGNNNYIKNKTTTKKKDYQKLNDQQNNNIEFINESISKEVVFNNLLSVSKLINPEKENNIMKIKLDANNQNYDKELLMPNLKFITVSKSTKDSSSTKNNANGDFSNLDCPEELHFYNINLIKQTKKFLSYKFDNTDPYDLKI